MIGLENERGDTMAGENFEKLEVWQLSRRLVNEIYDITVNDRLSKDYVLKDQIRRAAISIMSNIAEGFERGSNREFIRFLYIAKGSCGEIRSQLYVAYDRNYISGEQHISIIKLAKNISVKLSNFIKVLKASNRQ
jgi:four helix bundle protein